MEEGGDDRAHVPERGEDDCSDDEDKSTEQVLIDRADSFRREENEIGQAAQIVVHEGHIRSVNGDFVAERTHGDSEIPFCEGGRIVQSIADDHDFVASFA